MSTTFDRILRDVEVLLLPLISCLADLFSVQLWLLCAHNRAACLLQDPFVFSPHHKAIREPFDYYMFGQNYIRPLIDFRLPKNLLSFWAPYFACFLCFLQYFSLLSTTVWIFYNHVTWSAALYLFIASALMPYICGAFIGAKCHSIMLPSLYCFTSKFHYFFLSVIHL